MYSSQLLFCRAPSQFVTLRIKGRDDRFQVTTIATARARPVVVPYPTLEAAMRAASGLRAILCPGEGGRVVVQGPSGVELQVWIEHPDGGRFSRPGGFYCLKSTCEPCSVRRRSQRLPSDIRPVLTIRRAANS